MFICILFATIAKATIIDGWDFNRPDTLQILSKLSRKEVDELSPAVRREYFKKVSEKHSGGIVEKSGAGSGLFLIVDSTRIIAEDIFVRDFSILKRVLRITPLIIKGEEASPYNASAYLKKLNANAAVFIVDSSKLPRLITAAEEGWAIVNIADLKDEEKNVFEKRVSVEVIRGLAQIFGAGNNGLSLTAVTTVDDIDKITHTGFPQSAAHSCSAQMNKLGFEPKIIASYRVACIQGWAPAPTNETQQAIWDKVKAEQAQVPTKPIKITPDMKPKGK